MCDPLTLTAMALSTAGGIGQAQTQADYVDAVNRENKKAFEISREARLAEKERQEGFQATADATFTDTLRDSSREDYDTTREAAADDFVAMLTERPDVLNDAANFDTASDAVKTAAAARTSQEAAKSRDRIKALANLTSYGTTGQGRARNFQEGSGFLSLLGNLRRGSLGVANQEQGIPAANVTPGDSTFAQILSGLGSLVGMAGPGLFGNMGGSSVSTYPGSSAPTHSLRPVLRPNTPPFLPN